MPPAAERLMRVPINLGALVTLLTGVTAVATFGWVSAARLSKIENDIAALSSRINETAAAEMDRHRAQQVEIDRQRLEQISAANLAARMDQRLIAIERGVDRIEQRLTPTNGTR